LIDLITSTTTLASLVNGRASCRYHCIERRLPNSFSISTSTTYIELKNIAVKIINLNNNLVTKF
jgi:hypothetical protein